MDRRSWPWWKKSSEIIVGAVDSAEASPAHSTRHSDEQIMPRENTGCFPNKEIDQGQQSDEKVEQLKERLSVALLDASAKDLLIKQHAKVAEDAVLGWEKAEVEAQNLKEDLDSVMQQKVATQDRVSHLDDALKECMRQLRHVREEQEAKIHDATMKNLRDWEKAYVELAERMADMEQKYLAADAENKSMAQVLQEQAVMITKMNELRSSTESNIGVLQSRLEATEQDYASVKLKYSKLLKEFDIRNEDKHSNRRSIDAASKQHLENARKIIKLEEECQRLRGLVRTKVPGGGASIQMKSHGCGSKLKDEGHRKKTGKGATPSRVKEEESEHWLQELSSGGKDGEALLNRLTIMGDETQRLQELLARRDGELQQSRLMCARTASKLSSVEEQLECLLHDVGARKSAGNSPVDKHIEAARSFTVSGEPSLASVSEDGNDDCSDAWASALISELAHIKIEKGSSSQEVNRPEIQFAGAIEAGHPVSLPTHDTSCPEQKLVHKDAELYDGHQIDGQMGDKPQSTERQMATLQPHSAETELQLQTVQCQLHAILQARDTGNDVYAVLDQVREAMGDSCLQTGQTKKFFENADQKAVEPRLISVVTKLVGIAENFGVAVPSSELFFKNDGRKATPRQLSSECQLYPGGAADTVQFLEDVASALDILRVNLAETAKMSRKNFDTQEVEGFCNTCDGAEMMHSSEQIRFQENKISTLLSDQEIARLEGELRRVHGEKVALETHMRIEFQRFEGLQKEISQLQEDKSELEHLVEVMKGELQNLKTKLKEGEQAESSYQEKLSSAEAYKKLMEEQFQSLISTKGEVESQLKMIKAEHLRLQDTQGVLERECAEKTEKVAELEIKYQEISSFLSQNRALVCPKCSTPNGWEAMQEEEIAVKLAECQETILLLGKQLKTITDSNDSSDPLINKRETYSSPNQYNYSHLTSELCKDVRQPSDARTGMLAYKQLKMRVHAQKQTDWEPQRESNASDTLDLELLNLSKSGRPLLELFGNKTPAHEHYIKAVEQLTSSSDDEFIVPKKTESLTTKRTNMKPPLHRKKKSERPHKGLDMSKSMDDDTGSEKLNPFTRLFSRGKNS